jgi:hypothetical protein
MCRLKEGIRRHTVSLGMPKTSGRASAGKFEVVFRHVLFWKYIYIYLARIDC